MAVFFLYVSGFVMGITRGDDSNYLAGSLFVNARVFLHYQDWSPLYYFWFKLLRKFLCPNPISLYFLSWGILVLLLAMLPAWHRIRNAWIYSLILLSFPFLTIKPFVSLFGAAILLAGMCQVLRRPRPVSQASAIFCLAAFVTAFARPEFDYGVYMAAAVTLLALVLERWKLRADSTVPRPPLGITIALACCVLLLAGTLFKITRQSLWPRSGIAFAQHYNLRASEHHIIVPASDAWKSDYAERQFGIKLLADYGTKTATVFDFFRANPRLFLGHLLENLKDPRTYGLILVFSFVVLVPWVWRSAQPMRYASIYILLLGIPCIAASVVIYPRSHYALVLIPSLLIYALQLFDAARWLPSSPLTVLFAGCTMVWLTNVGLYERQDQPNDDQVYLQQIRCVRRVDMTAPPGPPVFETQPIVDVYFIHRRTIVITDALPQWADFKAWTAQHHPAWIAADETLTQRYRITPKELDDTLRNGLGYVPNPCPYDAHMTVYTPVLQTP